MYLKHYYLLFDSVCIYKQNPAFDFHQHWRIPALMLVAFFTISSSTNVAFPKSSISGWTAICRKLPMEKRKDGRWDLYTLHKICKLFNSCVFRLTTDKLSVKFQILSPYQLLFDGPCASIVLIKINSYMTIGPDQKWIFIG